MVLLNYFPDLEEIWQGYHIVNNRLREGTFPVTSVMSDAINSDVTKYVKHFLLS